MIFSPFGYPLTSSATSRFVFTHIHLHFLAEWAQNMYSLSWFPVDASYRLLQIFMLPTGNIFSAPGFPSCFTSRYVFHIVTLKSMHQQHFLTAIHGSQLMIPYDLGDAMTRLWHHKRIHFLILMVISQQLNLEQTLTTHNM